MSQSPPPKPNRPQLQQLQQVWRKTQPVLKTQSVRTLRLTIRLLEGAVQKLEAAPPASIKPPQAASDSVASNPLIPQSPAVSGMPQAIAVAPSPASPTPPPIPSSPTPGFITRIRPAWKKFEAVWNPILSKIRSLLPAAYRGKFSNPVLTSAIVGLIVMTVWTTSALRADKPPAVATAPPAVTAPAEPPALPEPSPAPIPPTTAPPSEIAPPLPSPIASPSEIALTPELAAPQELTAPAAEQPIETLPTIAASPNPELPPPIELSPEQRLIAAIQDQVSEISSEFADGLITSIQANFRSSRLTVKMGNDWYELPRSRQDRLAAEMLKRSRELEFGKLEITDTAGTLLARSPVVGSEMVILQRTQEAE